MNVLCICVCVFVHAVFVSLSLCRQAKPPVPQPHLWSPGKWLIWKYNHSGQDFISSLYDSTSYLYCLSYLFYRVPNFCLFIAVLLFPSLLFSHETPYSSPSSDFCCLTQSRFFWCSVSFYTQSSIWRTEPCWALTSHTGTQIGWVRSNQNETRKDIFPPRCAKCVQKYTPCTCHLQLYVFYSLHIGNKTNTHTYIPFPALLYKQCDSLVIYYMNYYYSIVSIIVVIIKENAAC